MTPLPPLPAMAIDRLLQTDGLGLVPAGPGFSWESSEASKRVSPARSMVCSKRAVGPPDLDLDQ
jgi:hypothetical protein